MGKSLENFYIEWFTINYLNSSFTIDIYLKINEISKDIILIGDIHDQILPKIKLENLLSSNPSSTLIVEHQKESLEKLSYKGAYAKFIIANIIKHTKDRKFLSKFIDYLRDLGYKVKKIFLDDLMYSDIYLDYVLSKFKDNTKIIGVYELLEDGKYKEIFEIALEDEREVVIIFLGAYHIERTTRMILPKISLNFEDRTRVVKRDHALALVLDNAEEIIERIIEDFEKYDMIDIIYKIRSYLLGNKIH